MKKLKPFDVQAALIGEPVMLRDGSKAYVRHHETELDVPANYKLLGYIEGRGQIAWREKGFYLGEESHYYDIIGMYPKTRTINGFEVPAPETKEPESLANYYLAVISTEDFYRGETWTGWDSDRFWLKQGLIFLNKEDAIANAKAMLGIDPNKPSMD